MLILIPLSAQNFSITYKTPDQLLVCEADTLTVTVQNNTGAPLLNVELGLTLPSGLAYVPGSILGGTEWTFSIFRRRC